MIAAVRLPSPRGECFAEASKSHLDTRCLGSSAAGPGSDEDVDPDRDSDPDPDVHGDDDNVDGSEGGSGDGNEDNSPEGEDDCHDVDEAQRTTSVHSTRERACAHAKTQWAMPTPAKLDVPETSQSLSLAALGLTSRRGTGTSDVSTDHHANASSEFSTIYSKDSRGRGRDEGKGVSESQLGRSRKGGGDGRTGISGDRPKRRKASRRRAKGGVNGGAGQVSHRPHVQVFFK